MTLFYLLYSNTSLKEIYVTKGYTKYIFMHLPRRENITYQRNKHCEKENEKIVYRVIIPIGNHGW